MVAAVARIEAELKQTRESRTSVARALKFQVNSVLSKATAARLHMRICAEFLNVFVSNKRNVESGSESASHLASFVPG